MRHKFRLLSLLMFLSLVLLACSFFNRIPQAIQQVPGGSTGPELSGVQNGERIYFTAINAQGEPIRYRGGPNFGGMMMGSYLTCAACHGPEASGGVHYMHMLVMDAPDIRYQALSGEEHEHTGDENSEGHQEYSLDDFRQAVVEGEHPDGEHLDGDMPRWDISDADLADLFAFLKSLP